MATDIIKRYVFLTPHGIGYLKDGAEPTYHLEDSKSMESHGWINCGEIEIEITRPLINALIGPAVSALREQRRQLDLKAHEARQAIEAKIANLQALEYTEGNQS